MTATGVELATPLIELKNIRKSYGGGDSPQVDVLRGIDLSIHAGEFVAIVGASGSGKSTLMNILGCLDRPTAGDYLFAGENVAHLDGDALAWLRREAFGFVFQGYHLIPSGSAQENVEMPAIYAGISATERHARAKALLTRLGLADRTANRPHQLSGGQQQRVSIARALMNGGHIILADEPTGALDSHSGAEVMILLDELASQGHVVILITHDREVAARANRIIEIRDGLIISDSANDPSYVPAIANSDALQAVDLRQRLADGAEHNGAWKAELVDAVQAAWRVMWINKFRTALTLLGIIIGVASVVVMLAVGEGSKRQVMAQMGAFGSNIIYLSGSSPNPRTPLGIVTLNDVAALAALPQVKRIMPVNGSDAGIRFGNLDYLAYVGGNDINFPDIFNWPVVEGSYFTEADERAGATVAVIGHRIREKLFKDVPTPIGQYILIENVPFQVIGVLAEKGSSSGNKDSDDRVAIPYTAASVRLFGTYNPEYVAIAAADARKVHEAEQAIDQLMLKLHNGKRDYQLTNNAAMIQAEARTQNTLSLMLGSIAAISLLVGGIGVMNIMLMTVRERTREIGIRMATGARQRDILRQFLTEAVMLSVVGGLFGIALALLVGGVLVLAEVAVQFSLVAVLGAFGCALVTGVIFGFMPARKAARLDPVKALTSE
ncbi:MacB family efflux pump subunit [Pseudomonas sp. FP453]|nr:MULTISPECIES: MacB family efflux pump subunit [unclassified Pseudomonas]WLH93094.1 MacB family efflux pump subunit [Pseudomonas sp. FP453]